MDLVAASRLLLQLPVVGIGRELGAAGVAHAAANASVYVLLVIIEEVIVLAVKHHEIGTLAAIIVLDEVVLVVVVLVEGQVSDVAEVDVAAVLVGELLAQVVCIVRRAHRVVEANDVRSVLLRVALDVRDWAASFGCELLIATEAIEVAALILVMDHGALVDDRLRSSTRCWCLPLHATRRQAVHILVNLSRGARRPPRLLLRSLQL